MSLTGKPLILLAALITLLALGATVWWWQRSGRLRPLVRPLGVLLTEALLIVTCGLWANRHAQFYPTWSALLAAVHTEQTRYPVPTGALDPWLTAHPPPGGTFAWQPAGWTGWHLAQAPTVTVPASYATHPDRDFSAVVLVGTPDPALAAPDDVVLISVPVTESTAPRVLATALPEALAHDLRVTSQRWAIVVPDAATVTVAAAAVTLATARYPAVAIVGASREADGLTLPPGVQVHRADTRPAALDWAVAQTPPPLAPAAPADPEGRPRGTEQSRR